MRKNAFENDVNVSFKGVFVIEEKFNLQLTETPLSGLEGRNLWHEW